MKIINYLDEAGVRYLWNKIKDLVSTKVTAETGKGLSTNDYTTFEKEKLASIAMGAEVNVNADWNAETGSSAILNRPSIPTNVSELTNDAEYIARDSLYETAASTATPLMDGTPSAGTAQSFARGDHVHPSDNNKVDKVAGKGLSTEDYTTAEKTKLNGIAAGANVNVQSDWNATTGDAVILNKPIIPTLTSELTNNSDFVTSIEMNTAIGDAINDITSFDFSVVNELPLTGEKGIIYLLAHTHGSQDIYDEYIYVTDKWEKIGNTDIDLSNYLQSTDVIAITNNEIDTITNT